MTDTDTAPTPKPAGRGFPGSRLCRAVRAADARIEGALGALSARQRSALIIGVSLLFAGAMIGASWYFEGERGKTVVFWLIALWWVPYSVLLSVPNERTGCEDSD